MQIPRRVDYGLRDAIYLAGQDPKKSCSVAEIAGRHGIPPKFLKKIIQSLIRSGLVKSKRDHDGGYTLTRSPVEITFRAHTTMADVRKQPPAGFSSLSSAA